MFVQSSTQWRETMKVLTMIVTACLLTAAPATAGTWWLLDTGENAKCNSGFSPAETVELFPPARLVDMGVEVDVISADRKFRFFRSEAACSSVAASLRAVSGTARRKLDPYR